MLLETGKLQEMKKYLNKKEYDKKTHKKRLSKAHFRKDSQHGLSIGASKQFRRQSGNYNIS